MSDVDPRPNARDSRRRAILDTARGVFLADGFADASMATVAARVGGSKGTLYNYFPSKEELFAAVVQDECDRRLAGLFGGLQTEGEDLGAVLKGVGDRYAELVLSDDVVQINRVVIAEAVRFPELGRIFYEAGPRRSRLRLAAYLEEEMQAGRLRRAEPMLVAAQFLEMCLGGLQRQRLVNVIPMPGAAERAVFVDAAVAVILAAYAVTPAAG